MLKKIISFLLIICFLTNGAFAKGVKLISLEDRVKSLEKKIVELGNDIFSELRNHPLAAHIASAEFCDNVIRG